MTSIAECYRRLTGPYGEKAPYYSRPQGHSGADYAAGTGAAVVTYETITITTVEWSQYIGWCVEGRTRDGRYIGWAHLRRVAVKVGQQVTKGQSIAEVAGASDRPGSTWFGAHIHTTLGDHSGAIFWGMTYDPVPRINAAKAAETAGGGTSPLPTPSKKRKKKDMAASVIYTLGGADKDRKGAIYDTDSGLWSEFGFFPVTYADDLGRAHGNDGAAGVTAGHFSVIKRDVLAQAARNGRVVVDHDDKDIVKIADALKA